jgi:hypothetical protein
LYDDYFDGTRTGSWASPALPEILTGVRKHCELSILKPELREIAVAVGHSQDAVYSSLVTLRLMQLDLAGDKDYDTTYVKTLKYDSKRLWKLVIGSRNGIDSFETRAMGMNEEMCGLCDMKLNFPDEIYVVPCSKDHKFHVRCLEKWADGHKYCPYDP